MFTRCPRECDLSSLQRGFALGSNDIEVWEEMEGEKSGGDSEMQVL